MALTASLSQARAFFSRRRVLRWGLPLVAVAIFGVILGSSVAALIDIPEVETITEFSPGQVTNLLDREGSVYSQYSIEQRFMLEEGEVPKLIEQALIANEDANFYRHGGIDAWGIARASVNNVLHPESPQGASTLTMQLAGMLFLDRTDRSWKRKIPEAFYAVALEKVYSKEQILTRYANEMFLNHGMYGFEAASHFYFDKPAAAITLPEAAVLVSILPSPSRYSPIRIPDTMLVQRNLVLGRMLDEGFITKDQHEEAVAAPLGVAPRRQERKPAAYFAEEVRKYLIGRYGEEGLYERGLRVRTTLDPRIQEAAEEALRFGLVRIDRMRGWRGAPAKVDPSEATTVVRPSWRNLHLEPDLWVEGVVLDSDARRAVIRVADDTFVIGPEAVAWTRESAVRRVLKPGDIAWFQIQSRAGSDSDAVATAAPAEPSDPADLTLELMQEPELEGAALVLDITSGAVRAMVGGWDFERSEFNRAIGARRQVGSAFKPFVYAAAFEARYSPADTLFDAPVAFVGADNLLSYSPRNYYQEYEGIITLRRALELSVNVTAVKLQDLVGVERVIEMTRRCGITSPLFPYPSLALGSAELSLLELTAAYASFANQGLWVEPYWIETVETSAGRVLERHQASASQAMDVEVAYLLNNVLRGVASPRGTAPSLATVGVPIAGKTGTTDDHSDAWFMGTTPRFAIGVWIGFDQRKPIGRGMTGNEAAVPVWKRLAERGVAEGWILTGEDFVPPSGVIFRPIDRESGLAATASSPIVFNEAFIPGTEPVQEYVPGWDRILALPWYQQRAFYGKPKADENMPEDVTDWSLIQNFDVTDAAEYRSTRRQ